MNMTNLVQAFLGGLLIGLAAILLLLADGKIAGISGMISGLFRGFNASNVWQAAFLSGLILGGFLLHVSGYSVFVPLPNRSIPALIAAGLLVGYGTQLGSGCTSGHSVCGLGRGSLRSLIATLTFMATGALIVFIVRHFTGGAL